MKTNEFIKEVEAMGFVVKEKFGEVLEICTFIDDSVSVATVWKNKMYAIETKPILFSNFKKKKQEQLFKLLTEYASTPIEEREEEKKYMYRVRKLEGVKFNLFFKQTSYLNFNKNNNVWFLDSEKGNKINQTIFTHSELKTLGVDIEQLQEVYEEIEVEE